MKTMRYKGTPELLARWMEEYQMSGYDCYLDGDEIVIYYGKQPRKTKKQVEQEKAERWSKRERNFGYTRG